MKKKQQQQYPIAAWVCLDECPGLRGAASFRSVLAATLFARNVSGNPLLFPQRATALEHAVIRDCGFVHIGDGYYRRAS